MSIQTLEFISSCSTVHGRIADASISVDEFDSMIRGQHIYKSAWAPLTDETLKCIWKVNRHAKCAVDDQL